MHHMRISIPARLGIFKAESGGWRVGAPRTRKRAPPPSSMQAAAAAATAPRARACNGCWRQGPSLAGGGGGAGTASPVETEQAVGVAERTSRLGGFALSAIRVNRDPTLAAAAVRPKDERAMQTNKQTKNIMHKHYIKQSVYILVFLCLVLPVQASKPALRNFNSNAHRLISTSNVSRQLHIKNEVQTEPNLNHFFYFSFFRVPNLFFTFVRCMSIQVQVLDVFHWTDTVTPPGAAGLIRFLLCVATVAEGISMKLENLLMVCCPLTAWEKEFHIVVGSI